ncbi:MAG: hypothetical protein M1823_001848 [Watsoniomyces obsoletus]|nr:MAG: hypothetical protein M1823_001848 [Watsoniomyces obsoletus]
MAFNAKNLTYEAKEPAFLRRLKQQHAPEDGARRERPVGRPDRPKRLQMGDDDEDDAPTYVDGDTNEVITSSDYQKLVGGPASDSQDAAQSAEEVKTTVAATTATEVPVESDALNAGQANVAQVGERRKKRVGKVVGDDDDDDLSQEREREKGKGEETVSKVPPKGLDKSSAKKTRKKVKLSFDDEQ